MNDALLVGGFERFSDLARDRQRFVQGRISVSESRNLMNA